MKNRVYLLIFSSGNSFIEKNVRDVTFFMGLNSNIVKVFDITTPHDTKRLKKDGEWESVPDMC